MVPSLANAGRSLRQRVGRGVGADALVLGEHDRVALALRDLDGRDLVVEDAVLLRDGGELVRARRERVLLLAGGDRVARVVVLGRDAHRDLVERAGERVEGHRVDQRDVAVLEALARLRQQVRRLGHRLHAAGDDDLELAGTDELVGQRDRVEAGQADLVDGQRRDVHRDAALDRGLAGGDLAGAGLDDLAHDHVVDLVGRDAGALERGLDRDAAEVGGGEVLERAEQPAHRGTGTRDDDGRSGAHDGPSCRHHVVYASRYCCEHPVPRRGPRTRRHRHRPRRVRRARPRRRHRVLRPRVRPPARAPRDQRGAGRRGGDGRHRRLVHPAALRAEPRLRDREVPRAQRRGHPAGRLPGDRRRGRRRSACATPACACCTTPRAAARPARGSTSCTRRTPAACSSSWSNPPPSTDRRRPRDVTGFVPGEGTLGRIRRTAVGSVGDGRDRRVPHHPQRRPPEADVQQILDAILSGTATTADFAALAIPESYRGITRAQGRGAHVRRADDAGEGPPHVAAPRRRTAARARPGRGAHRRDGQLGQLQHRVVEHLRAGLDLRLPRALRPHQPARQAARPALPRHRLRPVRRRAAHRPRRAHVEGRRRGRRALPVGRAREPAGPQRHDARPRAAHLGLRDQLRRPRRARPGQGQPAAAQARPPHVGGGRGPRAGQLHGLPPARELAERRRHEAGRHRADLGRLRRPRLLRHADGAQRRRDADLRRLQRRTRPTSAASMGAELIIDRKRRGLPVLEGRADPGPEGVAPPRRPTSASSPAARTSTSSSSTRAARPSAPASTSRARAARSSPARRPRATCTSTTTATSG